MARGGFATLPQITKHELRENFPANFLSASPSLDDLLARNLVELEHTSGTSADRVAVVFARNWWNEQEARVLRLNDFVAQVLDEFRRRGFAEAAVIGETCAATPRLKIT